MKRLADDYHWSFPSATNTNLMTASRHLHENYQQTLIKYLCNLTGIAKFITYPNL